MAYSPMQDAVTEVRVSALTWTRPTATPWAQYNVITKSGTNGLHGSAYIYNQTSAVDANSFFNNAKAVPRPPYHQNQYGITDGGPVLIPKVFNGKNRVFWFFGWEGMRDLIPPTHLSKPAVRKTSLPCRPLPSAPATSPRCSNSPATLPPFTIRSGVLSGTLVSVRRSRQHHPQQPDQPCRQGLPELFPDRQWARIANGSGQQNYVINAVDSDGYDNELGRMDISISDRNRLLRCPPQLPRAEQRQLLRQPGHGQLPLPHQSGRHAGGCFHHYAHSMSPTFVSVGPGTSRITLRRRMESIPPRWGSPPH